jgi:hypothetical protein
MVEVRRRDLSKSSDPELAGLYKVSDAVTSYARPTIAIHDGIKNLKPGVRALTALVDMIRARFSVIRWDDTPVREIWKDRL